MAIDTHEKAQALLHAIANSLYDRDPNNEKPVFFSMTEIQLVDQFLKDVINEHDARK